MAKDPKHTSYLHIDCTPRQKARYVQTAQRDGLKLGQWVRRELDRLARFDDEIEKHGNQ